MQGVHPDNELALILLSRGDADCRHNRAALGPAPAADRQIGSDQRASIVERLLCHGRVCARKNPRQPARHVGR